jgi:glutamine amidotransferase
MIAIIDYQAGNQTSVFRALNHLGLPSKITSDPKILEQAQGLIFPGVGAAGQAMNLMKKTGLDKTICSLVEKGRPFLGICLGCQIMLEESEENQTKTLGLLPGKNVRFDPSLTDEKGQIIRIPHMGWNTVKLLAPTILWEGLSEDDQFYFVHSFYPKPLSELVLGQTHHGLDFAAFFGREGLWALQFHPEKSGPPGLKILKNFYNFSHRSIC